MDIRGGNKHILIPGKVPVSDSHEDLASPNLDLKMVDAMEDCTHCIVILVTQSY